VVDRTGLEPVTSRV